MNTRGCASLYIVCIRTVTRVVTIFQDSVVETYETLVVTDEAVSIEVNGVLPLAV